MGKVKGRGSRSSPERPSHDQAQAEERLASGIAAMGLPMEEVKRPPGSDARKVPLMRLPWERTARRGQRWMWVARALTRPDGYRDEAPAFAERPKSKKPAYEFTEKLS